MELSATTSRSCVKTFTPETAGVKAEQPQLAVARAAIDLQAARQGSASPASMKN
jgi:hypothetical protein